MREVLALDLSKLSLRTALIGTIVLGVTVVLVGVFGNVAIAAGLAAVFVIAAGPADTRRPDLGSVLLVVIGAVVTFLVSVSASSPAWAAVVITVITLAATLLAMLDQRSAKMGVYGLLWAVLVLDVGATADTAVSMAIAFAFGGVLAVLALWISYRFLESDPDPEADADVGKDAAETTDSNEAPTGRDREVRDCPGSRGRGLRLAGLLPVSRESCLGGPDVRAGDPAPCPSIRGDCIGAGNWNCRRCCRGCVDHPDQHWRHGGVAGRLRRKRFLDDRYAQGQLRSFDTVHHQCPADLAGTAPRGGRRLQHGNACWPHCLAW